MTYLKLKDVLFVVGILPAVCGVSCVNGGNGNHSMEAVSPAAQSEPPASPTAAVSKPAVSDESPAGHSDGRRIFDMAQQIDFAHIRSGGLLIDFGHPARNKYTIGDWKTGWRGNFESGEDSFSYIEGKAARVFFSLRESEAGSGKLVIRARGIGQKAKGRLYINGKSAGTLEFGDQFTHVSKDVEKMLQAGTNELLLRFENGARGHDGRTARLAVDYIRVIPAETSEGQAAAAVKSVLANGEGGTRSALLLRKGDDVAYYLPIPAGAVLDISARSVEKAGKVNIVAASREASLARKVLGTLLLGRNSEDSVVSLSPCEETVCELSIEVETGEVLFDTLSLRIPSSDVVTATGKRSAANVVVLLIDTLRADHLSAFNSDTRVQTPFLDSFAKEAVAFDRAWAQENWTKPSIASLLTGLYSAAHQTKTEKNKIPETAVMMQEHFAGLGFETAGFVANGYVSDKFGFKRGWHTWTNYVREGKRNRAEFVAEDAVNWLKRRKEDKPFYLYIHTIDPHVPYIPPARYRALYDNEPYNGIVRSTETAQLLEKVKTGAVRLSERDRFRLEALYDGEISYHDEHIAKVYAELGAQGLLDNTVIVVTADHGEEFFEHDSVGHGHTLYEELLHVPLMIRLPGAEKSDEITHFKEPVELVDVFPTVCELLGMEPPSDVQGESLLPQLNGVEPNYPNAGFSEFMDGQLAARTLRYKLIFRGLSTTLFDLKNDPRETADLSDEYPEALVMMRDLLGLHMGMFAPDGRAGTSNLRREDGKNMEKSSAKKVHEREDADIDAQTRKQLEALGYMGD